MAHVFLLSSYRKAGASGRRLRSNHDSLLIPVISRPSVDRSRLRLFPLGAATLWAGCKTYGRDAIGVWRSELRVFWVRAKRQAGRNSWAEIPKRFIFPCSVV